jgi:hypothetical protein
MRPKFARSSNKIICRIHTRIPIPLEMNETIPQLGQFTLRDEGHTIASGKVLKFRPSANYVAAPNPAEERKEEVKADGGPRPAAGGANNIVPPTNRI